MMTRRTLLKLVALLPLAGPAIAKALTRGPYKPRVVYGPYLPRDFPKWNKAIDGLEEASKWATAFERSQLPSDTVFPRVGQIWEALHDCQVNLLFIVNFRKNRAGIQGGTASLKQGTRVQVIELDGPKPLQVSFRPFRWGDLQVPERFNSLEFSVSSLWLKTVRARWCVDKESVFFTEAFRLVEDIA